MTLSEEIKREAAARGISMKEEITRRALEIYQQTKLPGESLVEWRKRIHRSSRERYRGIIAENNTRH